MLFIVYSSIVSYILLVFSLKFRLIWAAKIMNFLNGDTPPSSFSLINSSATYKSPIKIQSRGFVVEVDAGFANEHDYFIKRNSR